MITDSAQTPLSRATRTATRAERPFVFVPLVFALFFVQFWGTVAGFTVRSEDVLIILTLGLGALGTLISGRLRYRRSPLDLPLLAWIGVIALGVVITQLGRYPAIIQRDALVNGIRLSLAGLLFFLTYWHPAPFAAKARAIITTTLGIGVITTGVSLLQIGYWDGWLPIGLPSMLTEMVEGSNMDAGREIFGLYLGNSGTHTWSGMVAMQALLVWLLAWRTRALPMRMIYWAAFVVLSLILVRMSVRGSIVGLFITLVGLGMINAAFSRYAVNRIVGMVVVPVCAALALIALFVLAPSDVYFIERIRQAIPQIENGELTISRGSNLFGRIDYIAMAWQFFLTNPIFGTGFGSYSALASSVVGRNISHAHNSYAQILTELGIVGFAAMAWLISGIITLLWRTRTLLLRGGDERLMWQWAVGAVIFLFSTAFIANSFGNPAMMGLRMVLLGIVASAMVKE